MLKLENIAKYYTSNESVSLALKKVNLELNIGEFVAVTGESGSGKSTLLNVLSGIDTYEEGEMYVNGGETSHFSVEDWEKYREDYIGFIFQEYNLIDSYTVLQNVELALFKTLPNAKARRKKALEILGKVGLLSHRKHKATKLSGGQKQRVVIARALAKEAPVILADEPTGNLDSKTGAEIMRLLAEISRDKLVVVVTHNYEEVEPYATRKLRLFDGEFVEDKQVHTAESVQAAAAPQSPPKLGFRQNLANVLRISRQNLIATPKRSVFIFLLLFLFTGLFTLLLGTFEMSKNVYVASDNIGYIGGERIIVNKRDSSALTEQDFTKIKQLAKTQNILTRDYMLDAATQIEYPSKYGYNRVFVNFMSAGYDVKYKLKAGRLPENADEMVVIYGSYPLVDIEDMLGRQIDVNGKDFTLTGIVQWRDSYKRECILLTDEAFDEMFYWFADSFSLFRIALESEKTGSEDEWEIKLMVDETLTKDQCVVETNKVLPTGDLTIKRGDVFGDYFAEFALKSQINAYTNRIRLSKAGIDRLFPESHQCSVMLTQAEVRHAERILTQLENAGYRVFYPMEVYALGDNIETVVLTVSVFVAMVLGALLLYLIMYLVTMRAVVAKGKDYVIMRSIGFKKRFIKWSMLAELIILGLIAYTLAIATCWIVAVFQDTIQFSIEALGIGNYLFILALTLGVAALLAHRYSKKIFGKSIHTQLGEAN